MICIYFLPSPFPFPGSSQVVDSSCNNKFTIVVLHLSVGIPSDLECPWRAIYRPQGLSSAVNTPFAQQFPGNETRVLSLVKNLKTCSPSKSTLFQGLCAATQLCKRLPNNQNTHATAPRPPCTKLTRAHKIIHDHQKCHPARACCHRRIRAANEHRCHPPSKPSCPLFASGVGASRREHARGGLHCANVPRLLED